MTEVWKAAVETKNNVMMWWWVLYSFVEVYKNSEARLVGVAFPKTNEQFLRWREENIDYCSTKEERRTWAEPIGIYIMPVEKLMGLFGASLKGRHDNATKAKHSPV